MKGSQESLTTVVVKDAANWPTPNAQVSQDGESPETWLKRKEAMKAKGYNGNGCGTPLTIAVQLHGPAAPANPSTDGSRQGLWLTPRANEPDSDPNFVARNADRGAHCHGTLSSQAKQWATPRSGKTTDENPETWAVRQAKGDVATMPLTAQVKAWATPKASDPQHSGPNMRDSAGNYALPAQVTKQWATPRPPNGGQTTSGAEQKETKKQVLLQHQTGGKLNPRWVETLMGLPVGWVMPSCAYPATIAPTNSDSWATESSQPPQRELFEF
jgi:hypothetical protein